MIARLKPGVTIAIAQQRIDALNRHNVENAGKLRKLLENARFATVVHGLKDQLVGDVRPTLYLLQCAVAFVLLIGCVNVANLMLVRSSIRMKELAIRYSLGAGRGRLAGQLLIEAMALAIIGGVFGVITGMAGVRLLALIGTGELPRGESHSNGRRGTGLQRRRGSLDRTGLRQLYRSTTWSGAISTPSSAPPSGPAPPKSGRCGRAPRWSCARCRWPLSC